MRYLWILILGMGFVFKPLVGSDFDYECSDVMLTDFYLRHGHFPGDEKRVLAAPTVEEFEKGNFTFPAESALLEVDSAVLVPEAYVKVFSGWPALRVAEVELLGRRQLRVEFSFPGGRRLRTTCKAGELTLVKRGRTSSTSITVEIAQLKRK